MAADDLRAMQRDLDALRDALDLDAGGVDTALGHALIAVAGLLTLAWVALAPAQLQVWGLLSILLPCGYLVTLRATHRETVDGADHAKQVREPRDAESERRPLHPPVAGRGHQVDHEQHREDERRHEQELHRTQGLHRRSVTSCRDLTKTWDQSFRGGGQSHTQEVAV